ncbi:hypothetical protein [Pseudoalteromonas byunsanensis]|uniref:Uncharacterized protein n=1 Tax=Pseudoalteromonas byunsanensis TaxID=327939 RepID=A0A1S1N003_9GAMM|nr:hypothetical protein [Pseudoalteromonas byunsanensis]OHU94368.1 hypothetical protein BIW53_14915 [Pseudoalteromonas byunsanensis]
MYLPVDVYKNILRFIGVLFICVGGIFVFSAFETLFDPSVVINLNGVERNDAEAKMFSLMLPLVFIFVGLALCISKGETLTNIHKDRETFWSIFHGK